MLEKKSGARNWDGGMAGQRNLKWKSVGIRYGGISEPGTGLYCEMGPLVLYSICLECKFNHKKIEKIWSLAYLGRKSLNMLMLVRKFFFDYAYVSPENVFDPPPPPPFDNVFRKYLYDLVKMIGNVGQIMTTPPPPPNVDRWLREVPGYKYK